MFRQQMDDDWYRVTTPWQDIYFLTSTGQQQSWRPDISASPMGCLEQFQWCNSAYPRERGCGPLASYYDSIIGAAPFFNLRDEDLDAKRPSSFDATSARFIWPVLAMDPYPTRLSAMLRSLGTGSLASQSRLTSGVQSPLPENQWQLDVLHWWNIIMASVQASWLAFCPHSPSLPS